MILEVLVNQDRKESKGEKTTPWMCADVRSTRSPHQLRQKRLKFSLRPREENKPKSALILVLSILLFLQIIKREEGR